jgi:hypothetical protein
MAHRRALLLATVLVAACQSAGTPTSAPTAAVASPTSRPVATATPLATKPVSLQRVADVPLDGTCEAEDVSCFGKLEPGKVYKTKVFEPTLTFSVPTSDWVNVADLGGDFGLQSTRDIGDAIIFFRDARSVDDAVGATVSDIEHWLETNGKLTVTPAAPVKVGGLTGVTLDLRVRAGAANTDPGCPVQVCVPLLRGDDPVPNDPYKWHWDWSEVGTEAQRLYLLTGKDTVIAIFVDSLDGLTFDTITKPFDEVAPTIVFS